MSGEVGGGLSVALGFLTPLGAAGILGAMAMATFKNHWKNGFWLNKGGYEYSLMLLIVSIAIGLIGPGSYSLDTLFGINLPQTLLFGVLAVAALLVDVIGILSSREAPAVRASECPELHDDASRWPKPVTHRRCSGSYIITVRIQTSVQEGISDTMTTTNNRNQDPAATITTWEIDPKASRVEFTARMRLMFVMKVSVLGRFSDVTGTLTVDEHEPINSHVTITIGTPSLDTQMAARDKHLHSADFFDVEHYPAMTFTSQRIEALDRTAGHYRITGTLTIREVSREVSLDAWNVPPRTADDSRLTFNLTTVLDRRNWGLTWNGPIQKIADEVNLALTVQFVPVSSVIE